MTASIRAVVTGAASGLGRALALDLAGRGSPVVVADIDEAGAEETAQMVESRGGVAHVVLCDVRVWDQVSRLAERSRELLGGVDLVANNAGVAVGGPFDEIELDDWRWAVDINLWGVIHGCRAFLPAMRERKRGYIVNIASMAGLMCTPYLSAYNVTKAGVIALSETLYAEAKPDGVNVTAVCPSFFATNITRSSRGVRDPSVQAWAEKAMQRSTVQADDVARIAVDAVLAGELYALPMRHGRVMWRLKRAAPWLAHRLLAGPLMAYIERQRNRRG